MRPSVLTLVAIALLIVPAARAGDVEDLKTAHEAYIEAVNKQDISALMASGHDDFVSYGPNPGFPFWPWHGHSIHPLRSEQHVLSR